VICRPWPVEEQGSTDGQDGAAEKAGQKRDQFARAGGFVRHRRLADQRRGRNALLVQAVFDAGILVLGRIMIIGVLGDLLVSRTKVVE